MEDTRQYKTAQDWVNHLPAQGKYAFAVDSGDTNRSDIRGLELVKSEFAIKIKRINTLANDVQACITIPNTRPA